MGSYNKHKEKQNKKEKSHNLPIYIFHDMDEFCVVCETVIEEILTVTWLKKI